jgi:peptide/nickel transport system substrate-binding protein
MNGLKIALLTAIVLLLAILFLDRWRQPEQLGALDKSFREMAEANRAQTEELRKLRAAVEARPVAATPAVTAGGTATAPQAITPSVASGGDGVPRLDGEFLCQPDRSYIDPAHMGGVLRSFGSSPKGLNPLLDNDAFVSAIHDYCNESLAARTTRTPEKWTAQLAESAIISNDYKTYTFRLKKGVKWQTPVQADKPEFTWLKQEHELTSADFAFVLRLIMDPKVDCEQLRGYYQELERFDTPDPYTLQLTWKKKVYTSLSASLGLSPLPRHIYGRNRDGSEIPADQVGVVFNKHWFDEERGICGVGEFQLAEFVPDKVLRLRRNSAYHSAPAYHFAGMEFNLEVKQDDPQLVAFKNGQVHRHGLSPLKYKSEILDHKEPRFAALDPADPKAGRKGELGWETGKRQAFTYVGWNCRRPIFADVRTRQAMSYLFPKERIIRDVFMGLGQPVLSDVLPDSEAYNRNLQPYDFDPATAKALLAEAGWSDSDGDGLLDRMQDGKRVPFHFAIKYYANSPEWDNSLAIFRTELKQAGIELEAKSLEWKELIRVYEDRDFDAVIGGWQMDFDIDFYQLWHSSQIDAPGGSNHCGFSDPEVDRLALALREEFDQGKRIDIIRQVQARLNEQQPYTFFMSGKSVFIWQNRAPAGSTEQGRFLDGVTWGLDHLSPLKNRDPVSWYFPR